MSAEVGVESHADDDVTIGYGDGDDPVIGDQARIRAGTTVYDDVIIGDDFAMGHNALIREHTTIGDGILLGTETVVDGTTAIRLCVSIQTNVYIPTNIRIGDDVFVGSGVMMTNDPYPVRTNVEPVGPGVESHASIGANATSLPGVIVGKGAFVATGAFAVNDVSPRTLAVDVFTVHRDLPKQPRGENRVRQ